MDLNRKLQVNMSILGLLPSKIHFLVSETSFYGFIKSSESRDDMKSRARPTDHIKGYFDCTLILSP